MKGFRQILVTACGSKVNFHNTEVLICHYCNFRVNLTICNKELRLQIPIYSTVLYTAAGFSQVLVAACENEVDIRDQHVSDSKCANFGDKRSTFMSFENVY